MFFFFFVAAMSVEPHRTYFQSAFKLLIDYQWIFKSSNTKYIADGILDDIPSEWILHLTTLTNEELNKLPFGYINVSKSCNTRNIICGL